MVTQVDFLSQTFARMNQGQVGTAPNHFLASSDQTSAVILTAGAIADLYSAGIVKAGDVIWVNGDQDGTPFQNVYTVTATSGGSLITYPDSVGGALLAANNLDDVASVATSRTNLGLGTADNVQFANIQAGASGAAGYLASYPSAATSGNLRLVGVASSGNYTVTISNASFGQSSVISIPDPGTATSKFVLQDGNNTVVSVLNLKYGATPVAQVDPASCTISAAAGASNTATVTIQLKDGSGTNMARSLAFKVYASSASDGLTLAAAASTGFSVASGGLSLNNGAAITTQISCMSSATGGCVLSLLDTGKQTSYLVLVLPNGNKISAQLSSGSYGA